MRITLFTVNISLYHAYRLEREASLNTLIVSCSTLLELEAELTQRNENQNESIVIIDDSLNESMKSFRFCGQINLNIPVLFLCNSHNYIDLACKLRYEPKVTKFARIWGPHCNVKLVDFVEAEIAALKRRNLYQQTLDKHQQPFA